MPWTPNDAERHTHKATTTEQKELWAKVANEALERTGDEGRAIREANAVIARQAEARQFRRLAPATAGPFVNTPSRTTSRSASDMRSSRT
jgi:hypothetical protein